MFSNFNSSSFENSYFEETSQFRSFDFKMEESSQVRTFDFKMEESKMEIQDEIYDFKMNSLKEEFSLQRVQFEETNMQQQKKRTAFGDITRSWKN